VGEIGVEDVGAVIVAKRRLIHKGCLGPQYIPEFGDVLCSREVLDAPLEIRRAKKLPSGLKWPTYARSTISRE
jgi:hypothetical protein